MNHFTLELQRNGAFTLRFQICKDLTKRVFNNAQCDTCIFKATSNMRNRVCLGIHAAVSRRNTAGQFIKKKPMIVSCLANCLSPNFTNQSFGRKSVFKNFREHVMKS